ncbi:hypothetical protein HYFRA_00007127 [Hymenoscyphus fraxineus]|uniref:Uncharacterized protein n=1 Tax=Hymenoscyphus fraxineus TaxID=746836 RepID=A0A9N9L021_9HELO|nr:hypothetical protein HYFRA_00007127 [Hymenoscyphus fraxineus]
MNSTEKRPDTTSEIFSSSSSPSPSSTNAPVMSEFQTKWKPQRIPTPYVNKMRLRQKLNGLYGVDGYHVKLQLNEWTIYVPSLLSEKDLMDVCDL